jgi:prepilin-type processing-associated H-X9-DG protein
MSCGNNLKQLGLGLQNYHDVYKHFPMAFFVHWELGSTPPSGGLNIQSWGAMLLPYIEQQALASQYDYRFPAVNEGGTISQNNVRLIQTPLEVFVCPSAPGGLERVYNGAIPAGALIPGFPALSWRAAPSDYCVSTGVRGDFSNIAYASFPGGGGGNRHGTLRVQAVVPGALNDKPSSKMADIQDGTSNTFVVGERTGGSKIYNKRLPWNCSVPPLQAALEASNGGGWGDALNGEHWLRGTLYSGVPTTGPTSGGGPCGMCTNLRGDGFHSFHPGGAQFAMADGSVQFISETAVQLAIAARITREKGEVNPN